MKAIVTGATSGIGEACALKLAENGYDLVITGRRADRLHKLAIDIQQQYQVEVKELCFDVRHKDEVFKQLESLPQEWKHIDVLVNNAGLSLGLEPINEGSIEDWEIMIDTNIKGLLYVSKVVSNWMVAQHSGHIINIGSMAGKQVYQYGNVYCGTKYAVDALSKAMRIDLLQHAIKVTALHPGAVETEFSEVRFKGDKQRAQQVYEGFIPLFAQDIAETLWFIVSRPAHVTINDILVMPTAQASPNYVHRQLNHQ